MRITPLDIRKQEFRKVMRGLDTEEVRAFLTTVADEYELVLNDNKALKERLLELDDKVQEYRNMEKTLRNTLLTAERVNTEAKENARREAGLIVKEAEIEAEKALRNIRNEQASLRSAIQELKRQKETYISRIKMVAEAHLKFIESAERDMQDEDYAVDSLPGLEPVTQPEPTAERSETADPEPVAEQRLNTEPQPERAPVEEMPEPGEEPAAVSEEMDLPADGVAEKTSLFPSIPESNGAGDGTAPSQPALETERPQAENVPDLNEILARMTAGQPEVSKVPEADRNEMPEPKAEWPAHGSETQSSPAQPSPETERPEAAPAPPQTPAAGDAPTSREKNRSGSPTQEWSLERLKRDILSGASGDHE